MVKLYALAYFAQQPKTGKNATGATYCLAASDDEAMGIAHRTAREQVPEKEGWMNFSVAAVEIPPEHQPAARPASDP